MKLIPVSFLCKVGLQLTTATKSTRMSHGTFQMLWITFCKGGRHPPAWWTQSQLTHPSPETTLENIADFVTRVVLSEIFWQPWPCLNIESHITVFRRVGQLSSKAFGCRSMKSLPHFSI